MIKKQSIIVALLVLFIGLTSCQKKPTASFTAISTTTTVGNPVNFINTSTDGESYIWSFGDGSESTEKSPTHTYVTSGSFKVQLSAFSKNGKKNDVATEIIEVDMAFPIADFSFSPTTVYLEQSVAFTDISSGFPSMWSWDFHDGYSNVQNPSHTFSHTGTFDVSLSASNSRGSAIKIKTVAVANQADSYVGAYNVSDFIPGFSANYTDNITSSSTVNGRVFVTMFGLYSGGVVYFDIAGNTVTLPSQTVNCGSPLADRNFSGSGTISGNVITINYTEVTNGSSVQGTETYVKQ